MVLTGAGIEPPYGPLQLHIESLHPPVISDFRSRSDDDPVTGVDIRFAPKFVRSTSRSGSMGASVRGRGGAEAITEVHRLIVERLARRPGNGRSGR